MLDRIREARRNESGFTLIELLIVIVILGVLSGIVVFAVAGVQDRGVKAACKSDVSSVEVALEAYYANEAGYPAANDWTKLTTAPDKFLKNPPSSPKYTITFDNAGVVTATPACNTF